jgi:fluoroquinolone transport system ATP-binding protein
MIEVHGLAYTYPASEQPAVRGLDFEVRRGETFGFLGPSGAGKSTTQKILIGLLRGFRGRASVLNRDLRGWQPEDYERIGVSFEVPNLYLKLSALENLQSFRSLYRDATEDPRALLEMLGLAGDADKRASELSRGMKVRLGFARALLNRPECLFLDEPTAGLDPVNARIVKNIIRARKDQGTTVFLTTHDMTVADELCDRVAFLVDGGIRLVGSPRDLKLQYGEPKVRVEFVARDGLRGVEFPLAGLADNAEFLRILREERVETLHSRETTLENVFIEVTGRHLR